jgi:hydrogenase maturation protein HypF
LLPGGDRAAREPRRSALGLLFEIDPDLAARETAVGHEMDAWFQPDEQKILLAALSRSVNSPRTSSMGRLFDAIAALCMLPSRDWAATSFEGQAAMALQFAADPACTEAYPLPLIIDRQPVAVDWEPLVRAVLADRANGVSVSRISARFHNALAALAVAVAQRVGLSHVVLSGGCFHNALLTERVAEALRAAGLIGYTHHQVPAGDGGIALGQAYIAVRQLTAGG